MRRIAVLDAPSNLGLRPPTTTSVPGCAKAPGALRDQGLVGRLRARDAGSINRQAHLIKGAVGNFDMTQAFTAAQRLEEMGRSGDLSEAPAALSELEAALERLRPALRQLGGG